MSAGQLTPDGPSLASMYMGEIAKWERSAHQEAESEGRATEQIFTTPRDRRTDDYVTGRFG